jgi:hypothetical protein
LRERDRDREEGEEEYIGGVVFKEAEAKLSPSKFPCLLFAVLVLERLLNLFLFLFLFLLQSQTTKKLPWARTTVLPTKPFTLTISPKISLSLFEKENYI